MATLIAVCCLPSAIAERPESWLCNGGFERPGGWRVQDGTLAEGGRPGRCLRFDGAGAANQDVLVAGRQLKLTAAVDVRVDGVAAAPGKSGYAFAAVYQLDEDGQVVAFHDFVQAVGTRDWQRHGFTFRVDPRTAHVSLRCGLHQATGAACFDNWTLVVGERPLRLDEVREPTGRPPRPGSAAILSQPDLPVQGKPSSPQTLAKILQGAGYETRLLSADEIADPAVLNPSHFDLLVVPTGQTFPAEARLVAVEFLRKGGNLLATGGYAFHHLVRKVGDRWVSEEELARLRLQEALQKPSLLPDGGFEKVREMPIGGFATDGQWRRASDRCTVVEEDPKEGRFVAKVDLPPDGPDPGAQAWLDLTAEPGKTYRVSGWMRTRDVTGTGIAFIAVYQYDAAGKLVEHRDFASARGDTPWQLYSYEFAPKPQVARLRVFFGFYLARGTAWFDDIRLVETTGLQPRPMNTSMGKPGDGLAVAPTQIGVFDPSFPLQRAQSIQTAADQYILREECGAAFPPPRSDSQEANRSGQSANRGTSRPGELSGWAASGLVGYDNARWVPLLETFDRYGRPRGAAGAMLMHYHGPFAGSLWAYFGLENIDLWADTDGPAARGLQQIARFMVRKTFLRNLTTEHRFYRNGEPIRVAVVVENRGRREFRGAVRWDVFAEADSAHPRPLSVKRESKAAEQPLATLRREVVVGPGASHRVEAVLEKLDPPADACRLAATLLTDGQPIDMMVSGFVFERPVVLQSGPRLRFRDNYFTLNGRPTFLFGSDDYAVIYKAARENPWTWRETLAAARDVGMNLYENLQYQNPGHRMSEEDWRAFGAMAQLAQRYGLVFMPGMLIGHNVAIGDAALEEESRLCREYALRLGATPGLLWYINGDYQLDPARHPAEVKTLWNRWLQAEYKTAERLREVWGAAVQGELGNLEFPPPDSGRWADAAAVDRMRFLVWLMRRWNEAHVAAVRQHDREHPITSEYYSHPFGGIDLGMSIDGQDVSNIGYFDRPGADLDHLPLKVRWNDLRLRGKGVSLGEYGVKTHPAWNEANGGEGYHIARSEEEQKQWFLAVAHYALGLGACKVQNWCLRDDPTWVFPWGIFHPNQLVPKDVAYVHRNLSLVWRFFRPVYRPERLAVCLANHLRLGNDDSLGTRVAYQAFADLLALHYPFNVIDDDHLDRLPSEIKAMILPCPLAMSDAAFEKLVAWVKAGRTLLVSGDFTHDPHRRRSRADRLQQLAGVEFVAAGGQAGSRNSAKEAQVEFTGVPVGRLTLRPCLRVKPVAAEVLGKTSDGEAVLVRHALGGGAVYFLTDPIEMADDEATVAARRQLYSAVLRMAARSDSGELKPLSIDPNEPWLHVMNQPTARGTVHVIYNTKREPGSALARIATAAGPVELNTRNRWPALAAVTDQGAVVAVNAHGKASVAGSPLVEGAGLKALLALDGNDLRSARAMLIAPFEPGRAELPGRGEPLVAMIGEFCEGRWRTLEQIALDSARPALDIDADRATCLILACPAAQSQRWIDRLTQAMLRPDQIEGH